MARASLRWKTFLVWMAAVPLLGCEAHKSPVEPSPVCTATVTPASQAFTDAGGPGTVAVDIPAGCSWSAAASADWVAITSGTTGVGPGSVAYTVRANAAAESRSAQLTIAEQRHAITQSGRAPVTCTYEIDPRGIEVGKDAVDGSFAVAAASDCAWTATSTAPWVTVTGATSPAGAGRVSYAIARNTGAEARDAGIQVGDRTFAIHQFGDVGVCTYQVEPVEFTPCMGGGTGAATLSTQAACPWTIASTVPWLTLEIGGSGSGPSPIRFAYTENYDAPREGILQVRWPTPTAGQNIRVRQAGCRYGVSQTAQAIAGGGGTGSFEVYQQSEPNACGGATQDRCLWSAHADVGWITVTTSMPQIGDARVSYTVAPNDSGNPRTGRIAVRDQVVVVTQAGSLLAGTWNGRLVDYPGGRTFQMRLTMTGDRIGGVITGDGTGGGGYISGTYSGTGPVSLVADFGDGKQYFDGAFDGPNRIRGTSTYNQRPPVYQFDMTR